MNSIFFDALKFAINPTGTLIEKTTQALINKTTNLQESGTIEQLKEESLKQEYVNRMSESQARVSQELAIAQRISTAEEVEIEEFYEGNGSGGIGVQTNDKGMNIGAQGAGQKVTRRIYRFKGWHDGAKEILEQLNQSNTSNAPEFPEK
ncbi:hypothetical protein ABEX41_12920 [Bacillus tropicus]|uniref:Uncharacterized protein n=1 Tax=Bacillus tropicus TaxID=2026188 RepID=A0A5C5A6T9_9BACI|nr:hypothetical protein [Bacillus tropicus]ALL23635.1 hypothetical protein BTXL6_20275 [Bacillus thuringiensis]EEM21343.1 hypothetical protein bthur0001_34990 [Bacillus thuringiensis serovar tochigiensis BGSC 4Y1]TNP15436.1 hypothetical protein FHY71_11570 [Bacillus tropicus]